MRAALSRTRADGGGTIFLAGEGGVGKTRLAENIAQEAERSGFSVAHGRAYAVESGVPYALFSDALLPLMRELDQPTLSNLARGGIKELSYLFPALNREGTRAPSHLEDPTEFKARLLWTLAEFLKSYAQRSPLLIVLDDLHWADASSFELLHFLARQTTQHPILFLCTYNETERTSRPGLRTLEKSLAGLGVARVQRVEPLTLEETRELLDQTFGTERSITKGFAERLFEWTKGNPFFLQETLKSLIDAGRLYERDGTWLGWGNQKLEVPPTVREAIAARFAGLSERARYIAELAAVLGTRFDLDLLRAVARRDDADLMAALDELRRSHVLSEHDDRGRVSFDFGHPMFRQGIYAELGIARAKLLHGSVATALEAYRQPDTLQHADELAYHFARAEVRSCAPKAVTYLAAAGKRALTRFADREAADYLALALELAAIGGTSTTDEARQIELRILEDLARARQRLGEFDAAIELFERARAATEQTGDVAQVAEQERRIGLAYYWSSRHGQALSHFDAGHTAAARAGNDALCIRVLLARGACLMELGRAADARTDIERALALAEGRQDALARARALRALLLLHTWIGPPEVAREYGRAAVDLAREIGATDVLFMSQWTLGVLEGLTGHTAAMAAHIAEAQRLASELHSPLLELWTAELVIEYAFALGDWDLGLAQGEQAIALARSLNQRQLLPRLLVWTSLIYLGRGDLEVARALIDEAWTVSGADGSSQQAVDVHTVVPAHIGLASYHLTRWEFDDAIRVAEAGLAIADRSGYPFWAIHRLLPIIAEASTHKRDIAGVARVERRLREESEPVGHKLGLAWAEACRALMVWIGGDSGRGAELMLAAVKSLEAIPIVPDAARLRRQLAGRLADIGDRAAAVSQLREVHDVFMRLGAELELDKTRGQFRELGVKPPAREESQGAEGLTGRELDVARLVARRKSNKAIGNALQISPRTVSTHLSNVFRKLEVNSRAELTDYLRTHGLTDD